MHFITAKIESESMVQPFERANKTHIDIITSNRTKYYWTSPGVCMIKENGPSEGSRHSIATVRISYY